MNSITFEDLRQDPNHRHIIELLEAKHGSPLPEEIQQYILDAATSSVVRVQQTMAWVQRTFLIIQNILSGTAHEAEYPLFWIYLYGIVNEFYEHESKHREINEQLDFKKTILDSLDSLLAKLDEDDLSFITYMRHHHVHMHLDYVWHKARVEDGRVVEVKPPYDPDARDIADRIIAEHSGDQQKVARTYAKRITSEISTLKEAIEAAGAI